MRVPVLTYHAMNVGGNAYADNDHVALASDLAAIAEFGLAVVPLGRVVDWYEGRLPDDAVAGSVAITIDDGSWFDWYDIEHPACGPQRSMYNIMRDRQEQDGGKRSLHLTSFVIASPEARASLDRSCMIGAGWWADDWWGAATDSPLFSIANHSWDHVHPELGQVAQREQVKGDFSRIECFEDAETQIVRSGAYIASVTGGGPPDLFAYPWGEAGDYLVENYLPRHRARHGLRAAFTVDPRPVTRSDSEWLLPRFVCGRDWDSPDGLRSLLAV